MAVDRATAHGGEARCARDTYAALDERGRNEVLRILRTLRTPAAPNPDVLAP